MTDNNTSVTGDKYHYQVEADQELRRPTDALDAYLDCARYNDGDDASQLRAHLMQCPTDVAATDSQGRTAVHMAAANGHTAILEILFEFHPHPDIPNYEGNTALHFAALNNRVEAAKILLQRGWSADSTNADNRRPIELIYDKGFNEMEVLLLAHDRSLDSGASPTMNDVESEDDAESPLEKSDGPVMPPCAGAKASSQTTNKAGAQVSQQPTGNCAPQSNSTPPPPISKESMLGSANADGIE